MSVNEDTWDRVDDRSTIVQILNRQLLSTTIDTFVCVGVVSVLFIFQGQFAGPTASCAQYCDGTTITIPHAATFTCTSVVNGDPTKADSGTKCTWTADNGYYLKSGSADIACGTDGTFAAGRPTFASSDCPPLSLSGHASADIGTCTYAFSYDSPLFGGCVVRCLTVVLVVC
jgi:hypothetical protein